MGTEWMGRYRGFVAALVWHGNEYARTFSEKNIRCGNIFITPIEWQVMEYLIEYPSNNQNMAQIARQLGLSTSTFSKVVSSLTEHGFVEKYMRPDNKKSIILRISESGRKAYEENALIVMKKLFEKSFDILSVFSDEELKRIEDSIMALKYIGISDDNSSEIASEDLILLH